MTNYWLISLTIGIIATIIGGLILRLTIKPRTYQRSTDTIWRNKPWLVLESVLILWMIVSSIYIIEIISFTNFYLILVFTIVMSVLFPINPVIAAVHPPVLYTILMSIEAIATGQKQHILELVVNLFTFKAGSASIIIVANIALVVVITLWRSLS